MDIARKNLVVADEDVVLGQMLSTFLGEHEFEVFQAETAAELSALLSSLPIDMVLVSPLLAGGLGLDFLRRLPLANRPAVIVTSEVDDPVARIVALELGADDVVVKPYNPREILARTQAVLRGRAKSASRETMARYSFAGIVFDAARGHIQSGSGACETLTATEAVLLSVLVSHPRETVSRSSLSGRPGARGDDDPRSIDQQISRLRRKLQRLGAEGLIRTVRGRGYAFVDEVIPSRHTPASP